MPSYYRKLEVSVAGRWYIALTILLGVIALTTGNNVLCLLESILLAALVVIGIISEHILRSIEVVLVRADASAQSATQDYLAVSNISKFPVVCLEIGEWSNKEFFSMTRVAYLKGKEELFLQSSQIIPRRGTHRWEGLAISTSFPTGFTTKYRFFEDGGERIIWPEKDKKTVMTSDADQVQQNLQRQAQAEISEGEIRPMNSDDDLKWVVWTASQKGQGFFVRSRQSQKAVPEIEINLKELHGAQLEQEIIRAASAFYHSQSEDYLNILIVFDDQGKSKITGRKNILNFLATVQEIGKSL